MKIGLVRRGYSPTGGAEAYLLRLAEGLAQAGHEPVLVSSSTWPESAWSHGPIVRLPGKNPSAFAAAFHAVKPQFDITLSLERTPGCDVFRAGDGVHAAWLARRAKFEPRWKSLLRKWNPKHGTLLALERQVFSQTRLVIANSNMVATEIETWFGVSKDRIRVIPNGIGSSIPPMDREAARSKLGIPNEKYCVLFAGSGWERKGLTFAIAAVDSLREDALLLVAGKGQPAKFHAKRAQFLGPTRDLPAIFSAADVFVLPTIYDPFSNACLEALAVGLPVVTTHANGFSEIIQDGIHGSIVEPGNIPALAQALESWRHCDRQAISAKCRALASEYSLERNTLATIAVLEDFLA
jgi:UDP-glucose:(heptosyl)LPS alpha-1,3-glucosyltransferase